MVAYQRNGGFPSCSGLLLCGTGDKNVQASPSHSFNHPRVFFCNLSPTSHGDYRVGHQSHERPPQVSSNSLRHKGRRSVVTSRYNQSICKPIIYRSSISGTACSICKSLWNERSPFHADSSDDPLILRREPYPHRFTPSSLYSFISSHIHYLLFLQRPFPLAIKEFSVFLLVSNF